MAYFLETISSEDEEKILKDAECDENKKNVLVRRRFFEDKGCHKWAIDRDKNSYLFSAPKPPKYSDSFYYFYFRGFLYGLRLPCHPLKSVVEFQDGLNSVSVIFPDIKQAIYEAIMVYRDGSTSPKICFPGED